jgi:hypothetical protein
MTLLLLNPKNVARGHDIFAHPVSLRSWLAGDWGLLFSHADDFAHYDMETDRWIVLVREAFAAARLRPLGLERHPNAALHGWIAEVNGGARSVRLPEPRYWPHIADFRPHALREALQRSRLRFVMIVDEALQLRRTLFYSPGAQLPSLFDLIALGDKARALGPARMRVAETLVAPQAAVRSAV